MIKNKYPGKFIVIDGLDGSGQSTQVEKLTSILNERKYKLKFGHTGAYSTKEPTSGLIGGLIRSQLSNDWHSSPECLQLLFAADRSYHLEKEVIPLLKKGVIVVSDRYFFSSFAYGTAKIKDLKWLYQINKKFLYPDLTIFLKVSPEICMTRILKERFALTLYEKKDTLEEVWKIYEKIAKDFKNIYIVNGERPAEKITKEILKILEKEFIK